MSDNNVAISVRDIHKDFVLPQHKNTTFKQTIVNIVKKNNKVTQKVLDGVSFEINKGDFFGIVGRNGSGKSTLLKLIAGVYTPTSGNIAINGGLTPFIELGVGFNPELSGRDNVFLNGALLGFNRDQMATMYDEIVEFAELKPFMDQKLKNYSSGMQVRLAFSIAVKAKNDILIFDEVLAVGDEAFQRKCMEVFREYRRNKQTVVLVTHSMDSVREYCTRALMLEDGKIQTIGNVQKVSEAYSKSNEDSSKAAEAEKKQNIAKTARLGISGIKDKYAHNDTMCLNIRWKKQDGVKKVGVAINGIYGEYVFGSNTGKMILTGESIDYTLSLNLGPGKYFLTVVSFDEQSKVIEVLDKAYSFIIADDQNVEVGGLTRMKYSYDKTSQNSNR